MYFVGDIHRKWTRYLDLIKGRQSSVQVGDFGIGFTFSDKDAEVAVLQRMAEGNHRFIRGNHDNPAECARSPQWIPDGTVEDGIMYVGGARSIDQADRIEGEDWWADEELSMNALGDMIELYEQARPRVMVTHECPEEIARQLFRSDSRGFNESRTRRAFDIMMDIHQPDAWVFGHWHKSRRQVIRGTDFICLRELETVEL